MKSVSTIARSAMIGAAFSLSACNMVGSTDKGATATATEESESEEAALDPILAEPRVGDLWSGELTAFSAASFGESSSNGNMDKAYGMMRVVNVTDDKVTIITEQGAYPAAEPAVAELNSGSLNNVTWDESEQIPVTRSTLQQMVSEGKLRAWRRP